MGERAERRGELITVDTTGGAYLASRLVWVPWQRIDRLFVPKLGGEYQVYGQTASMAKRTRLASVSRFPQGLSGDLLARVLAALKQSELDAVR
jgi:hypothetical protein